MVEAKGCGILPAYNLNKKTKGVGAQNLSKIVRKPKKARDQEMAASEKNGKRK